MPTRAELIEYYRALPDDQLMRIALYEATDLTEEAIEVLKGEIRTRRLGEPVEAAIQIQTCAISPEEQQDLVARFRRLPCPICGAAGGLLNFDDTDIAPSDDSQHGCEQSLARLLPTDVDAQLRTSFQKSCACAGTRFTWP